MDIIYITQLKADVVIGVFDWERRIRQRLSLDLEIGTDIRPAAASDQLADTLDYATLSERLVAFAEQSEFQLIETLAEQLAAIVLNEFKAPWLRLKLSKRGAVAKADDVGLIIERGVRS